MDLFLFISILVVISASILAYILTKNRGLRNRSRLLFFVFIVVFIVWTILNYLSLQSNLSNYTLWIVRVVMVLALTHTTLIYLFAKNFPHKELILSKRLLLSVSVIYVITFMVTMSSLLFSNIIWLDNSPKTFSGPGVYVFGVVTLGLIIATTVELINKYRVERGIVKKQILYLLVGELIMFALLFFLHFVVVIWFDDYLFIPLGGLPVLLFVVLTTYAITRYRLFGVKFIFQQFIIKVMSLFAPLSLYGLIVFILHESVFSLQQLNNIYVNLFIIVLVVTTFNLIRNFVFKFLTQFFERTPALKSELIRATQSGDRQDIVQELTKQYLPWIMPDQVGVVMFKSKDSPYTFYPEQKSLLLPDSTLIRDILESQDKVILTGELSWQLEQGSTNDKTKLLHKHLVENHISAVVMLISDNTCIGLVVVKDSNPISTFAAEDIIALKKFAVMLLPIIRQCVVLNQL